MTIHTCEISNPSDEAHIRGTRAGIQGAVFILGEGMYGAVDVESGEHIAPLFLLGGFGRWATAEWGHDDFDRFITENSDEIIAALDSVRLGGPDALNVADEPGAREIIKEERRSSLNDIAGQAWKYADLIRARFAASADAADARSEQEKAAEDAGT